jgi:hypothetical protein
LSGAQITNAIADFYQPGVSVFSLKATSPEPDPKIKRSLLTILQGKFEGISFTPDFLLRQKTGRGQYAATYYQQFQTISQLDFLYKNTQNGEDVYYYLSTIKGKTVVASITITNQQQVAGYGVGYRL